MTDRSVATAAASEAVAGIREMSRLLELYKGSDLARLYEIQTKQKKRLIIGAQPLIPPSPEAMMNMQLQLFEGIEGAKKFIRDTLLIGWWFTRTVAVFDGDMLGELMETDSKDLYVSISQFRKFLGNPVLIPFEKPYEIDDTEIFGCIVGFFEASDNEKESSFLLFPIQRQKSGGKVSFPIIAPNFNIASDNELSISFPKIIETTEKEGHQLGFELYKHELFSKIAYLLTETPDVESCMSESAPSIVRRRKKPDTIFAPEKPKFMMLGKEFGDAIRQYKVYLSSSSEPRGTVKPHIRRAHWHTYLSGKGREKRILKWVLPILVKSADLSAK